jgi:uncharacterized protein YrzB (UPF0473 family)
MPKILRQQEDEMKRAKLSFISLSAILIMIFIFTFPVSASEATQTDNSQMNWMDKGWGQIHKGETFKPDANLTRGELVALINSYFDFKEQKEISFDDVKSESSYYKEVSKAFGAGYVLGRENNMFDPEKQVTNVEAYIMISRILNFDMSKQPEKMLIFKDAAEVPSWAEKEVEAFVKEGFLEGKNKIKPFENMMGSDAVSLLEKIKNNSETVEELPAVTEEKGNGVAPLNFLGAYFVTIENNQSIETGTLEEGNTSDEIIIKLVFDRGVIRDYWENNQTQISLKDNKGQIIASEVFRIENSDAEKSYIFIKPTAALKSGKTVNIVIGADLKANNGNTFGEEKTISFTVK